MMATGDTSVPQSPPPNPPELAPSAQLASMNQSAQQTGGSKNVSQAAADCPQKKSWFSVSVMQEVEGAEESVNGLTLTCHLPDFGESNGVTSSASPQIRFNNLNPGGTADVLATSHDDAVWEVTTDIS